MGTYLKGNNKNNEDIIGSGERKIYTFQSGGIQPESISEGSGGGDWGIYDQPAKRRYPDGYL